VYYREQHQLKPYNMFYYVLLITDRGQTSLHKQGW